MESNLGMPIGMVQTKGGAKAYLEGSNEPPNFKRKNDIYKKKYIYIYIYFSLIL